ncbi:MAG TPA: flagellar motor protein MotB [Bacteroidetes bacterium]|nr:flagellar motor protein MotB [Bacteroidota bacterium]
MAKKKREECPAGTPAWMVTYGDMMTLLLTFFVLIVSFSSVEQVKFKAAISSIQEGLGMWPENAGILPSIVMKEMAKRAQQQSEMVEDISEALEQIGMIESVEVYTTPSGVRLIISNNTLFESGQADLKPEFLSLLAEIAATIKAKPYSEVRVEGHTDNVPIHTSQFPSNWELSAARALAVTKYFVFRGGLDPKKLSAVGYGEYRPRATNATPNGRARNRRVEIYIEQYSPGLATRGG